MRVKVWKTNGSEKQARQATLSHRFLVLEKTLTITLQFDKHVIAGQSTRALVTSEPRDDIAFGYAFADNFVFSIDPPSSLRYRVHHSYVKFENDLDMASFKGILEFAADNNYIKKDVDMRKACLEAEQGIVLP